MALDSLSQEELNNLRAFEVIVRRHLGDETTNMLWRMTHETLRKTHRGGIDE